METKNYFVKQKLERAAWEMVSLEFPWTEELLEKWQDKVNWKTVSGNPSIKWTPAILDKFKEKIDWSELSALGQKSVVTFENLERFEAYWDWKELSRNFNVDWNIELLERFIDKWNWSNLDDNLAFFMLSERSYNLFNDEFFEKVKKYVPDSDVKESVFWDNLVEKRRRDLLSVILSD